MKFHKIRLLLLSTLFVFAPQTFCGNEVRNGGGLAEMHFSQAILQLRNAHMMCLSESTCNLNDREREILWGIDQELGSSPDLESLLIFENQSDEGGRRFLIDGQIRVAFTGNELLSPIHVNRDMIYRLQLNSQALVPLEVSEAVAILTHEFGHHHEVKDHVLLDILGAKVAAEYSRHRENLIYAGSELPTGTSVEFSVSNFDRHSGTVDGALPNPQVTLSAEYGVLDLSKQITARAIEKIASFSSRKGLLGFRINNLHWNKKPVRDELLMQGVAKITFNLEASVDVAYQLSDRDNPDWIDDALHIHLVFSTFDPFIDASFGDWPPILEQIEVTRPDRVYYYRCELYFTCINPS